MAPKRRTQSARATPATNQQSKLSFQNKVTKPGINQQTKANKQDPEAAEKIAQTDITVEDEPDVSEPTTAEKAIQQQAEEEAATLTTTEDPLADGKAVRTEDVLGGKAEESEAGAIGGKGSGWVADEEEQARKIKDTQIKQYWRKKEQERLAPRVHQQDLTVYEKVLREWDMSGQYGVSLASSMLLPPCLLSDLLTIDIALHRHSTLKTLEASQYARTQTTDRGSSGASQADGRRRYEVAEGTCG